MIQDNKNYSIVVESYQFIVRSNEYTEFMKNSGREKQMLTIEELSEQFSSKKPRNIVKLVTISIFSVAILVLICSISSYNSMKTASLQTEETFTMATAPIAAAASKRDIITIPTGVVKANPFVPYRSIGDEIKVPTLVNDVPKFDLIAPPEVLGENIEAAKILDTVVSGILYDAFSPSAILKIDGNDYLVKKGDEINKYKVIAITKDSVTVKFGNNTYKAGIGEILTEGDVKYNDVSNLSKKFGGEKR